MATNFPTSLDSLARADGTTTLGANDHSVLHNNVSDCIAVIEAKLGIDGSAVQASHDYKLSGITGSAKAVSTADIGTAASHASGDFQPADTELTALAGLTSAADKLPYFTGSGTADVAAFTAFARTIIDDADASTVRSTLGLGTLATQSGTFSGTSSGTNTGDQTLVGLGGQPVDATLTAFAALTIAADSLSVGTGADAFTQVSFAAGTFPAKSSSGTLSAKTITDFALTFLDDANAAAVRTTIGAGTSSFDGAYGSLTGTPSTFAPSAHASSHQNGGSDEIATATAGANAIPKAGSGGTLASGWIPTLNQNTTGSAGTLSPGRTINGVAFDGSTNITVTAAGSTLTGTTIASGMLGTGGSTACAGNDSRLSDSRTPTTHATTHKSGGSDSIKLDEFAAPTDITTLNTSTSAHGLAPKLSGNISDVLQGDGNYSRQAPAYVVDTYEIPEPATVEIDTDRWLEIDEVDGPLASICYSVRQTPNSNQCLAETSSLYLLDYLDITESYAFEIPATALVEIAETSGVQDFDIS